MSTLGLLAAAVLSGPANADLFACTEQGILDAIDAGGGPHTFDCEGPTTVSTTAEIAIGKDVVLDGGGDLTVDAGGTHRVFETIGNTMELRGMTVRGGNGNSNSGGGGGAGHGGGIYNSIGTLTLTDCTVAENTANGVGGGIVSLGPLVLANSTVSGNTASGPFSRGGGIMSSGSLQLTSSTVSGNTVVGLGGGIATEGSATLTASTVSGNTTETRGGGIAVLGGTTTLTNSTVSGNMAGEYAGAIYSQSALVLTNSTIAGNTAELGLTALYVSSGIFLIGNTLVAGSCQVSSFDAASGGGNVESPGASCGLIDASDQTNVTAESLKLGPLADNGGPTRTHALRGGSVAIDAALLAACPATDQRGVTRPRDGNGDGVAACDAGAFEANPAVFPCSEQGIRDAIAAGGGPHTFECQGPVTVPTTAEIAIDRDVVLDGGGNLTVDAGGTHRVFYVNSDVTTELWGMTVRNGNDFYGGGIASYGALTLRDSDVSGNTSEFSGGGIWNDEGDLTLSESTVSDNKADGGSGGGVSSQGTLVIASSTVSGNTASGPNYPGGGIFSYASLVITGSTFAGNSAGGPGGGIATQGPTTLTASTVSGNTAAKVGGGIAVLAGSTTLTNSTVSGNTAGEDAGGIYSQTALTLTNSTIAGNTATPGFSALYVPSGSATVENTLVDGNCFGLAISSGGNVESPGDTCHFTNGSDRPNVSAEQLQLGPLADNGGPTRTHALLPGSVAIDTALLAACPATDQRGVARPVDGRGNGVADCDAGAFEAPALPACSNGFDDDQDGGIDMADRGCTDPNDDSERGTDVCDDGIDNDGDGLADFPNDPGCPWPYAHPENPACDDGIDNDGNELVDFDDPKCTPEWPYWERSPCGLGAELVLVLPSLAWWWRRRGPRAQPVRTARP